MGGMYLVELPEIKIGDIVWLHSVGYGTVYHIGEFHGIGGVDSIWALWEPDLDILRKKSLILGILEPQLRGLDIYAGTSQERLYYISMKDQDIEIVSHGFIHKSFDRFESIISNL